MSSNRGRAAVRVRLQRGQSLVEFALVGPLLFLLIFVVIEAGLLMSAQAAIDNATREGARVAALCGSNLGGFTYKGKPYSGSGACQAAVDDTVRGNLGILTPTTAAVTTSPRVFPAAGGAISVSVRYAYTFYLSDVLGLQAPAATLTSNAAVVSQQ